MPNIERPAVEIEQGHLKLYLTYITPNDLLIPDFYDVDHLEPQHGGYQRILNSTRARRLSRHLTEGFQDGYANLPTTIFLATEKSLKFNPDTNRISFETDEVCPFSVVDGQHRIAGLIMSAQREHDLLDFKLPATIATSLDDTHQMYHFYIVNTTQRPVERALQQQITTRFTDMQGVQDLPYLPHWLRMRVSRGTEAQSLRLAEFLNEYPDSPLFKRIQMANDLSAGRNKIRQAGLVTMFKDNVFSGTNPVSIRESNPEKLHQIILNYFRAVDSVFVDPEQRDESIVYKSNGLFFFLTVSKWVFTEMYAGGKNFTEEMIAQTISSALDEMDEPYQEISNPDWWLTGQGASSLNRATARVYTDEFLQGLRRAQDPDGY